MRVWLRPLIAFGTLIHFGYNILFPQFAFAQSIGHGELQFSYDKELAVHYSLQKARQEAMERLKDEAIVRYHTITAYSSLVEETDASPFITASGSHVHEGIVAANTLPFGAKIMIPDLFGDKVFTVEDRMAPKNWHKIDIWFPSASDAKQFGVKRAKILVIPQNIATVLESPSA